MFGHFMMIAFAENVARHFSILNAMSC